MALALRWTSTPFLLVESQLKRAEFLRSAVRQLGIEARVIVVAERAESLARTSMSRGEHDLVTARGFGPPGAVAECAAPFLRPGGLLVVSEPPPGGARDRERWPSEGLAHVGMGPARSAGSRYRFVVISQDAPCPGRFPRRVGVPMKRPLF